MSEITGKVLFPLGSLYATPLAIELVGMEKIRKSLVRHVQGDWGALGRQDKLTNDQALKSGARLLSAYMTSKGAKFWVITEADRSSTTVLMPEEY